MKIYRHIDGVNLSESQKEVLINTKPEEKPQMSLVKKNGIILTASFAAVALFFGGVYLAFFADGGEPTPRDYNVGSENRNLVDDNYTDDYYNHQEGTITHRIYPNVPDVTGDFDGFVNIETDDNGDTWWYFVCNSCDDHVAVKATDFGVSNYSCSCGQVSGGFAAPVPPIGIVPPIGDINWDIEVVLPSDEVTDCTTDCATATDCFVDCPTEVRVDCPMAATPNDTIARDRSVFGSPIPGRN